MTQNHDMFATSSSLLRMPSWLKDNVKNLKKWMKPQRRHIDVLLSSASPTT